MVYRVDLLIDTDLGTDVDDVGMLCAAHALADLGEARILAVTHGTNLDSAVGAISAINHYYNRDDIAIGAYHGPIGSGGGQPGWTREGRGGLRRHTRGRVLAKDQLLRSGPASGRRVSPHSCDGRRWQRHLGVRWTRDELERLFAVGRQPRNDGSQGETVDYHGRQTAVGWRGVELCVVRWLWEYW